MSGNQTAEYEHPSTCKNCNAIVPVGSEYQCSVFPGDVLLRRIRVKRLTQHDLFNSFSHSCRISESGYLGIIIGTIEIDKSVAKYLSKMFPDTTADYWLELQRRWDEREKP